MGNTVTKESNDYSHTTSDHLTLSPRSQRSDFQFGHDDSEARKLSRGRHRQHHQHHHHGSKHHKSKLEGYEMIIDLNESVDGGFLFPQGVYQGAQDFKVSVVRDVIIKRKLAPFYKGLDAVEPTWSDSELLEHVRPAAPSTAQSKPGPPKPGQPGPPTEQQQLWLYRNVHECPICFLVYPRLNGTRCCGQDICTECFVQIKRAPPHPPYTSDGASEARDVLDLLSEPAACPYCAQSDLGVIFEAPPFEWGIPSSAGLLNTPASPHSSSKSASPSSIPDGALPATPSRQRRTSVPKTHPSVVTVDMIRPDWEDKLASARRRLARKSAAARALHRSALLPGDGLDSPAQGSDSHSTSHSYREPSSLSELVRATRSMSVAQSRALEQRMIDEAIKESLAQQ